MKGFEKFLKNSNFGGLPGGAGKKFFGDHVRNKNLGKVTEFGYPTITGVDMPEPNIVPRVTLTPPVWVGLIL